MLLNKSLNNRLVKLDNKGKLNILSLKSLDQGNVAVISYSDVKMWQYNIAIDIGVVLKLLFRGGTAL